MRQTTRESIDLLRQMVRIPSESFGEEKVCALISSALDSWGVRHEVYGRNILAFNGHFDPSKPTLALDAHIDTVPASPSYTRDPFDPGCDEDIVYGLGSNDDGGSVVAIIAVFRYFYDKEMPVNLMLCLNCEEERSGPDGARWIYSEEGPLPHGCPKWTIFAEPTGMKVATSERGLLVLDGEAVGVSGHAARREGVNALYIAMDDIVKLRAHKFGRISEKMGEVVLNVTQISAGSAHNVIPDRCSFVVDIRPTDKYTNEEIVSELQEECRSSLKARNLKNRSSATASGSPLEAAADRLGIEKFSSPTTSNWMRTTCDAIKMGPGQSSRSHRADEFILCSEIEDAVETYIRFIEDFYGNTLE